MFCTSATCFIVLVRWKNSSRQVSLISDTILLCYAAGVNKRHQSLVDFVSPVSGLSVFLVKKHLEFPIFWSSPYPMDVIVDVRQATDSGQKYSDVSSFPYIFHINLQFKKIYILKSIYVRFWYFLIDTRKIESS